MTGAEAREMFNSRIYAELGVDAAGWLDDEILSFIKNSSLNIIKDISLAEAFELISNLITTKEFVEFVPRTAMPNVWRIGNTYIDTYLYFVRANLTIQNIPAWSKLPCDFIQSQEASQFFETAYNKPFFRNPKIFTERKLINIVLDAYKSKEVSNTNTITVQFTYVETPVFVESLDSTEVFTNINTALHEKIIEGAIQLALKTILNTERSSQ